MELLACEVGSHDEEELLQGVHGVHGDKLYYKRTRAPLFVGLLSIEAVEIGLTKAFKALALQELRAEGALVPFMSWDERRKRRERTSSERPLRHRTRKSRMRDE